MTHHNQLAFMKKGKSSNSRKGEMAAACIEVGIGVGRVVTCDIIERQMLVKLIPTFGYIIHETKEKMNIKKIKECKGLETV